MASARFQPAFEERVEELVHAPGQGARARSLLACVASRPWVEACALWRRRAGSGGWACILSRGADELLPDALELEEVSSGRRSPDLIPGRFILVSGRGEDVHALALAGATPAELETDWMAALLHVVRLLDQSDPQDQGEELVPALPSSNAQPGSGAPGPLVASVTEILVDLIEHERPACARARIELELALDSSVADVNVPIPAGELRQAVHNLIVNAREAQEFSAERGWIRVEASTSEGPRQLVVAVEDEGPGLPQHVQSALSAHEPDALPGNGLGLAISAGIALGAGGDLRPGRSSRGGARLALHIPLTRPAV